LLERAVAMEVSWSTPSWVEWFKDCAQGDDSGGQIWVAGHAEASAGVLHRQRGKRAPHMRFPHQKEIACGRLHLNSPHGLPEMVVPVGLE
jgi:hypothetical protein